MYTNDRDAFREAFYTVWHKHLNRLPLDNVEAQLVQAMLDHPEYHVFFDKLSQIEFAPEENPFIHLSLHIALREQLQMDRPAGIRQLFHTSTLKNHDKHATEHQFMRCLASLLWQAQQTGEMPSDEKYLALLQVELAGTAS